MLERRTYNYNKNTVLAFSHKSQSQTLQHYLLINRNDYVGEKFHLEIRNLSFISIHHVHWVHTHCFFHISLSKKFIVDKFLKKLK